MDLSGFQIKQSKITNERQLILKQFLDRLNAERKNYPPLKPARVGMLLRYMTTNQLKDFYAELNQANHFSKSFWWRINPNNYQKVIHS